MPSKRHDWEKYKQDYFDSEIDEIAYFFSTYVIPVPPPSFKPKTQGWQKEKQDLKKLKTEKLKDKIAEVHGFSAEKLLKAKWDILKIVNNKLAKEKDELLMKDLKIAWEMIKAEVGEAKEFTGHEFGDDFKYFLEAIKK